MVDSSIISALAPLFALCDLAPALVYWRRMPERDRREYDLGQMIWMRQRLALRPARTEGDAEPCTPSAA
jgi:hypothetical protein